MSVGYAPGAVSGAGSGEACGQHPKEPEHQPSRAAHLPRALNTSPTNRWDPCPHPSEALSFLDDPEQCFSTRCDFTLPPPPQEIFGNVRRRFRHHNLEGGCCWHLVGGAQRLAKHPTMHRTIPTTKTYPVQNVISTEVEKLRPTEIQKLEVMPVSAGG